MSDNKLTEAHPTAPNLDSAKRGFDHLFQNQIALARDHFAGKDDPFHLLGLGVCAFLEAALGMEVRFLLMGVALLDTSLTVLMFHCSYSRP